MSDLIDNTWKDFSVVQGAINTHKVCTAQGKHYIVNWNDNFDGDGSKTSDIFVAIMKQDNISYHLYWYDNGYTETSYFVADGDFVTIKIQPYVSPTGVLNHGTYSIKVKRQD